MQTALTLPDSRVRASSAKSVYIYALKCPDSLAVRYIGKAKNPNKRLQYHLQPSQRAPKTHKNHWLNSLLEAGKRPLLEIVECTVENKWQEREQFYIRKYKKTGLLTNGTDGGDGVLGMKQSPETIARRIAKIRGSRRSPETRKLLSEIQRVRWANGAIPNGEKAVSRFSLDGEFIDSYPSITKLCRALNMSFDCVSAVLRSRRHMYNGYMFRYSSENESKLIAPYVKLNKPSKKVDRLNTKGELIESHNSVPEMCARLGLHKGAVYEVLKCKRKTTGGFMFRYSN